MASRPFQNRSEAGKELADRLKHLKSDQTVILALPRGGVPVAIEVAARLGAPLEILGVKKVGSPQNPELAIGAVTEDGDVVMNRPVLRHFNLPETELTPVIEEKKQEAKKLALKLRRGQPLSDFSRKTVIVVDDGLATGMTALAAARFLKSKRAGQIIFAAPVCAFEAADDLLRDYDSVICVSKPDLLWSVGSWYDDFSQVSDAEVLSLLEAPRGGEVSIPCEDLHLKGICEIPKDVKAVIVFAHGSGSGRLGPRNQSVARALNQAGLGTLFFDLLAEEESRNRKNVFNIDLLAKRLVGASQWLKNRYQLKIPIGYFGASTGAAAALEAAAQYREIYAVVSRGGRPDLASHLSQVIPPTLLIVGGEDDVVLELNHRALEQLKNARLEIIPGATHLFEEPGALEQVISLSKSWFLEKLSPPYGYVVDCHHP